MTNKIFRNTIISVLIATVVTIGLFFNVLYHEFLNDLEANLKEEVTLVENGVKAEGIAYFDDVKIAQRVTIIGADGSVLFDNHTDEDTLRNHADREEVIEAKDSGWGSSRRYSESVGEQSIYVAKALENGDILRISTNTDSAWTLLLRMSTHILWIVIITLLATFFIANRLAKKITKPLNEIDLDKLNVVAPYKELAPLYSKLQKQNYTISKQIQELNKRQDELKLVIQNMNEGIIMINKESKILNYNQATLALFDLDRIEDNGSIFEVYRSQDFMKAVEDVLKGESQDIKINHDHRIYNVIMGPVKNDDNSIAGATIIVFDITQKETQEIMRKEFSANVSHELKTPLTTISGFAELIKNGLADPKDIKGMAANIYDEAQRLIKLVQDIIHLSSLDTNQKLQEDEDVNIRELVNSVFEHQKANAAKHHITLSLYGDDVIYHGSYSILEEMINNLVDNAIKYGSENGYVKVVVEKSSKGVIIKVEDNGIGIPPNAQDRIFERFYRVDKSRSKELGGTGLGLSIVKHAAIYHGGTVSVESDKDGSTFTVELPNLTH